MIIRPMHVNFLVRRSKWLGSIAMMFAGLLVGCDSGKGLDKTVVEGTVTLDGSPIPNGEVLFYPIEGTQGSVSGGPIKDGKYVAEGRGGVPLGVHRVEIRAFRAPRKTFTGEAALEGGPAEQYLPDKYNIDTGLRAEVDASTTTLDYELTSK